MFAPHHCFGHHVMDILYPRGLLWRDWAPSVADAIIVAQASNAARPYTRAEIGRMSTYMLRAFLILGILTLAQAAEDRWVTLRSDGFELYTNAGGRAGRAELVRLEQFRFVLGRLIGKTELT